MRRSLPAPPPSPSDTAALAVVTELAEQLAAIARPIGVAVDRAYDEARSLERSSGFSPRSRALQSVAPCQCGGRSYPTTPESDRCKLFWCTSCKLYKPYCAGGAPDPRCDDCVMTKPRPTVAAIASRGTLGANIIPDRRE